MAGDTIERWRPKLRIVWLGASDRRIFFHIRLKSSWVLFNSLFIEGSCMRLFRRQHIGIAIEDPTSIGFLAQDRERVA
jgi:hypothetical protein